VVRYPLALASLPVTPSRGDLRFALPVGLIFDENKIVLEPDREVQGAVRTVFELFAPEGTAFGVVPRFQELGLRFRVSLAGHMVGAWRMLAPMCSAATNLLSRRSIG
jgi:hypothetical protein